MTNDSEQQMTGADERWAVEGDNGVERFSLWRDGSLLSEHTDCGVRLDVDQLRSLAAAAWGIIAERPADAEGEPLERPRDREWLLGQGEGLGFAAAWPKDAAEFAARWNLWGSEYRDKHVRRFVEYASRHIMNLETAPGFVIENGWIAQAVNGCTCGNGDAYPYGHQPGCGLEPIASVESALNALAALGGMTSSTVWTASYTTADHPRRARVVEIHSAVSAEDALDRAAEQPNAPGRNAIRVIETTNRTITTVQEVQS